MNALAIDVLIASELPAASGGDTRAYSRIVAACQNTVTAIALAITRDVTTSEDIAQEAFLSAWQNLRRLQSPASFLPWLRQITRNLAHDHLRGRQRRAAEIADAGEIIEMVADPSPGVMERLIEDERVRMADEIISALPDDSREVLLLYYREGQRSQQVAMLLGLSDAAVRKRLSRARAALRGEMQARLGEFARDTAPSVAFTAVVASALTLASPPAAAAGMLTLTAATGAKTLGKVVLGSLGTMAIAMTAAGLGIVLGLRQQLKGAIDERERRELKRSAGVSTLATVVFVIGIIAMHEVPGWHLPLAAASVFMAVVVWQSLVSQPRIMARRHALEAALDPVGAAKRRRRERIECWLGLAVGVGGGYGGLLFGLIASGRL